MPWPETRKACKEKPDVPQFSFKLLSYLFLAAVVVQFFLAGLGTLGGESIDAHRILGMAALLPIGLLMFGAAIWAQMGKVTIGMVFALFVLIVLQIPFSRPELEPEWLRSLHVLNALFIFMLGFHITQRAGPLRMPNRAG